MALLSAETLARIKEIEDSPERKAELAKQAELELMVKSKFVIASWRTDNYQSREEALADGAITEHEIDITGHTVETIEEYLGEYFSIYQSGLSASSERLTAETASVDCELVQLKPFTVEAEVLEWNRYTVTVFAESGAQAVALVKAEGAVTFSSSDVESGVTGFDGSVGDDNQRGERLVEGQIG